MVEKRPLMVDPKIVEEIQASGAMSRENPNMMRSWGGSDVYVEMARAEEPERLVYYAIMEGDTTPSQLQVSTGLGSHEIDKAIRSLERKGLVQFEESKETR